MRFYLFLFEIMKSSKRRCTCEFMYTLVSWQKTVCIAKTIKLWSRLNRCVWSNNTCGNTLPLGLLVVHTHNILILKHNIVHILLQLYFTRGSIYYLPFESNIYSPYFPIFIPSWKFHNSNDINRLPPPVEWWWLVLLNVVYTSSRC